MAAEHPPSRRVFLSRTSELRRLPTRRCRGRRRGRRGARGDGVAMRITSRRDKWPAQVCREAVHDADVYVLIGGFRFGSPVRDRPVVSYTELEFEAAPEAGTPRLLLLLVLLLGEDAEGTGRAVPGPRLRARQAAFRADVLDVGLTATEVVATRRRAAGGIAARVDRTAEGTRGGVSVGRVWSIPARSVEFTGAKGLLSDSWTALAQAVGRRCWRWTGWVRSVTMTSTLPKTASGTLCVVRSG